MNLGIKIQSYIEECDLHAQRLESAYTEMLPVFPINEQKLSQLSKGQLSYLDQMVLRFTKLQDTIGAKVFPTHVEALGEVVEKMTAIDILNRLEKAELLASAAEWREMRTFRNHLTHEYPRNPEIVVKNLNAMLTYVKYMLDYWKVLKQQTLKIKEQYERS
jgi:hypothetical protein